MRKIKYKGWRLLLADNLSEKEACLLFDEVENKSYKRLKLLKENQRSKVSRIKLENRDLVYKVPTEKNNRKWIRFLTWFRMGEAFKNIVGMQKLIDKGIPSSTPIMAAEKTTFGMVTKSWLLYGFIDGQNCLDQEEYYPAVIDLLKKMHSKKILHGDPQIRNFIVENGTIEVIDSNPKWIGITGFDIAYEWAYLRKSAPGIEKYFGEINDWWMYKLAFSYDIYERKLAHFRKRVKKSLKNLIC